MINKYLFTFILLFFSVSTSYAQGLPFDVGERLEFALSWTGIPAGTTVLEIPGISYIDGKEAFQVRSESWSNRFVSTFYKVEDKIEGYMDAKDITAIQLKIKQREGRHKKDKLITFDQKNHKVEYIKNGKKSVHEVPPSIRDSISSFYYLRTQKLQIGEDIKIETFTGGKIYNITVKVLKREKVKLDIGTFETIKVQPLIKHNDVFKNKGDMFIWLTDDEYKIPVMMKTEIEIGYIKAKLKKMERGGNYVSR